MFEGNFDMDKAKTRKITLKYSTFDQAFWGGSKPIFGNLLNGVLFAPFHLFTLVHTF